jgi:hypothetical protein
MGDSLDQTIPRELETTLSQFENVLHKLQSSLERIFDRPMTDHFANMTPLEKAKVDTILSYAVNTLFYSKI